VAYALKYGGTNMNVIRQCGIRMNRESTTMS